MFKYSVPGGNGAVWNIVQNKTSIHRFQMLLILLLQNMFNVVFTLFRKQGKSYCSILNCSPCLIWRNVNDISVYHIFEFLQIVYIISLNSNFDIIPIFKSHRDWGLVSVVVKKWGRFAYNPLIREMLTK